MSFLNWFIGRKSERSTVTSTGPVTVTKIPKQSVNINYYFTRATGDLDKQLVKIINSSTVSLDIAIYFITKPSVIDAIVNAYSRGVKVRIITDKEMSQTSWEFKQLNRLNVLSIPIKINDHDGLMHLKIVIVDNKIITTGSYNYTGKATTLNDENLVIITNAKVAGDFTKEFNLMWGSNNYKLY
ncbi:MAG TPA: phospholipase D-like domain-containing protein [Clostridium sp.]|uniref:phospholipase D-like domain-containing protein n=1 Tax=Clostridium sp. TaxID=1506 RepID=UPI002F94C644